MQLFSSWFSSGNRVLQDLIHEYECLKGQCFSFVSTAMISTAMISTAVVSNQLYAIRR